MSYLILQADARRVPLADGSVQCVVTSPPYFGLRDYGVPGQIGLEPSPDAFIAAMVKVFREVHRVLRDDGTLWLNLGDSYAGSWGNQGRKPERGTQRPINGPMMQPVHDGRYADRGSNTGNCPPGLKPKDLIGIPWRVALALQADGWWLRSDVIWAKPNPMPSSVLDRPTSSHEYLFLLAKSERYFFDTDAVREPHTMKPQRRPAGRPTDETPRPGQPKQAWSTAYRDEIGVDGHPLGRNLRTVWSIATEAYPGSHFATFPRRLVEPCIKAGTSEYGCCPACRAPWERMTETTYENPGNRSTNGPRSIDRRHETAGFAARLERVSKTVGWQPSCSCDAGGPIPCTVFDPFVGSGTTIVVANTLGRRAIGCDLSRDYLRDIARRRIERPHAPIARPERHEPLPLFADDAGP